MQKSTAENFQKTLNSFYQAKGKDPSPDEGQLLTAYEHTESLWWENLSRVRQVRYLLVGEAPLYGEKRAYIYNPETPGTAFLGKSTVEKLLLLKGREGQLSGKRAMLEAMRSLGLVVLDLFPFALNDRTQLTYARLSDADREHLAAQCRSWHLRPKLEALQEKASERLVCGVRYLRLEPFARKVLESCVPNPETLQVELACQRRANAPLDLERLAARLAN
ncbi:MAG: hypothetical protein ACO4AU_15580 [bacterium]|jgi:hypothetical protein